MPVITPLAPQRTMPCTTWVSTPTTNSRSGPARRDVLGRIVEGYRATELLEPDQVVELPGQIEKQLGLRLEAVVGAVVDDGGKFAAGAQHRGEVRALGGGRSCPRKHPRNDHEAGGANFPGMTRQGSGAGGALGAGPDDPPVRPHPPAPRRLPDAARRTGAAIRRRIHNRRRPASRRRRVPRPFPRAYRNLARRGASQGVMRAGRQPAKTDFSVGHGA